MRIHDELDHKPSQDVDNLSTDATVLELLGIHAEYNIGALLVTSAGGKLVGILTRSDDHGMDARSDTEIMKRWWAHMADIMATDADDVPVQIPLKRVFYLP